MPEKTMTDEDFDLAVGHVTSFYQSLRAKAKKQVAHWMGKFMIVKAENYTLRRKIRAKEEYAGKLVIAITRKDAAYANLATCSNESINTCAEEIKTLKAQEKGLRDNLTQGRLRFNSAAKEIEELKNQVKELEEGALV